ncbi:stress-inducible protein STI1 [Trypanosoma rangeli]|uniref:Stress-inducible protein STI1 n=1 Tax=Trypanosoma rangeli TaxID=5698 RepID=A0A3R7LE97_TRYRA|nr:stress-inducible protein STI1 [Trypanosoma rangeli]RNF12648.1 stress-inducible protein STI1 [Trypanosoma rangeli]|eukprot:RNF12648.1 stress-inducible protein STI1 [Trypanosoma rangeli]
MSESLEEDFTRATALVRGGNHIDAIGVYASIAENALATTPQKIRAYSNMSACLAARDQYAEALDAAKKALELDEQNSKVHGRVATAYHGMKHYEEAAQHYNRAHVLDPTNALYLEQHQVVLELMRSGKGIATQETKDAYYYRKGIERGKEAMEKGEYLSAVRHFSKAIELHARCATDDVDREAKKDDPSCSSSGRSAELAVLFCNRSAAYSRAGRYAESLEDGMKAMEVNPMYARAFFRIAHAHHQLKHPHEAYTALRRCLELNPNHDEAKALMIEVEQVVTVLQKTTEEKRREKEEQVQKIREMQSAERVTETAGVPMGYRSRAHATSYMHCSYCNEAGHSRAECPLLRRKRSRTS